MIIFRPSASDVRLFSQNGPEQRLLIWLERDTAEEVFLEGLFAADRIGACLGFLHEANIARACQSRQKYGRK